MNDTSRIAMPLPPPLDPAKLHDGRYCLMARETPRGQVLLHYDPERRIGATFSADAGCWSVFWPIEFNVFGAAMAEQFGPLHELPGFDTWIDAVDPEPAISPAAH